MHDELTYFEYLLIVLEVYLHCRVAVFAFYLVFSAVFLMISVHQQSEVYVHSVF
jgi:hypothetical protein